MHWQSEEIDYLTGRLNLSTSELYLSFCEQYGTTRSYDSVQKKIKKLRDAYSDEPSDDEEDIQSGIEHMLQEPHESRDLYINELTGADKKERKEAARNWLKGVIDLSDEASNQLSYHGTRKVKTDGDTTLCVLLSDTHFGKHTKWFDLEEAKIRMLSVPTKIHASALPKIDEVVVILGGDMVEGEDIYPTQNNHIECSAIEQVQVCSEAIWQSLLIFRELFDCTVRVETVPGNHGRVSKTANEKTNWDNVIYHMLRVMSSMHEDDNIIINCNFEPFRTFRVKDKVGMAFHHGVKHAGTPAMREKVAGWTTVKKFDFMVHGHWHEWHIGNVMGKFVVGNGCMCGPDDLAERMGKEDDARQAWFLVTPGEPVHGFSFVEWPINDQRVYV